MLEWTEEGSKTEQFTLVQSKNKRKKRLSLLENPVKMHPIRRSSWITPLVYRKIGGQENPGPILNLKSKQLS
jgi:hypothetical protein